MHTMLRLSDGNCNWLRCHLSAWRKIDGDFSKYKMCRCNPRSCPPGQHVVMVFARAKSLALVRLRRECYFKSEITIFRLD